MCVLCISQCRLRNGGHFVQGELVLVSLYCLKDFRDQMIDVLAHVMFNDYFFNLYQL